jgi:hypothetical protein
VSILGKRCMECKDAQMADGIKKFVVESGSP